jgi:hypothetical protein
MHELLRARYGQVPEARGLMTATGIAHVPGHGADGAARTRSASSAGANDSHGPDRPPDNGLKLVTRWLADRQQTAARASDVEAPDCAAPARVPPAVNDRAMNSMVLAAAARLVSFGCRS